MNYDQWKSDIGPWPSVEIDQEGETMRICDICKGPDATTWKVAVVRITVERLDSAVKSIQSFKGWDTCMDCLPSGVKKEVEVCDDGRGDS